MSSVMRLGTQIRNFHDLGPGQHYSVVQRRHQQRGVARLLHSVRGSAGLDRTLGIGDAANRRERGVCCAPVRHTLSLSVVLHTLGG